MADRQWTGASVIRRFLEVNGVEYVFGNPGTTELPLINEVSKSESSRYVPTLHEDVAVGMAAGYAKTLAHYTRGDTDGCPIGVATVHVAPGLAHGLGNIHAAMYSGAPILVLAGDHATDTGYREPVLSGDLVEMVGQFTKWSASVPTVDALPAMIRRAVRTAVSPPTGPVFLGLPIDVLQDTTTTEPTAIDGVPTAGAGDPAMIRVAAGVVSEATDPVIVAGDGIARSGPAAIEAVVSLAERTGAAVVGEILTSEANFPGTHPRWRGVLAADGHDAPELLDGDVVLSIGCETNTPIGAFDGPFLPAGCRHVEIHPDPAAIGRNEPVDVGIAGDPGEVVTRLVEALDGDGTAGEADGDSGGFTWGRDVDADRLTKAYLVDRLVDQADDALVVDESVTTRITLLEGWPLEPGGFFGTKSAGLGFGLPAAIGAALAQRTAGEAREVIGLVGDGAFLYYPNTLFTAAALGVDVTIVVSNNRGYGILRGNAGALLDDDVFDFDEMGLAFDTSNVAAIARDYGVAADVVEDPGALEGALAAARAHEGPFLLDVHVTD